MATVSALRPVACVAALNSAAQGLVGVVLGVLGLCVCFCALGSTPQSSGNDFGQYLTFYLQGGECSKVTTELYSDLTSPTALRVWLALSLFFSASMLASSLALFIAVARRWSDEKLQITLVSWLFINTFTAIDDVILAYVFGNDYTTARDSTSQRDSLGPLTLLLVTLVVARGVYLWLLNLVFIFYLFSTARALHKYLNQQGPNHDQQPIERWPTLDDFGKTKTADIERTPTAINPRLTDRMDSTDSRYPEYSAMSRWPALNGEPETMRESRRDSHREGNHRERRPRSMREPSFRRQDGIDNPAYDTSDIYYLRLQSDRDYDRRDSRRDSREHARSKREVVGESTSGQYKTTIPPPPVSPSFTPGYDEENGIIIPPIDYLDPPEEQPGSRPLTLQEAIRDKTLRLKKVPEELKRGIQM
ncbi:uncharacterized protein LOC128994801 [Macrosteles quadrilineatus]|uniref:uncharacterized protein LOC128994801 n=1 Tax=Macrosteles quadrilineatus TaxID=74068 RepID=UPI0023E27934|nr:uncharacterized protein LOC128994801 [Macrosteles quadrilineatus]